MKLYLRIYYLSLFTFVTCFISCNKDKPESPQSRTLYGVIFKDTVMYIESESDGSLKTLLAQNIPHRVTVTYSDNEFDRPIPEGTIAEATFSLQNSGDWWSFGDLKEYYKLEDPEKKDELNRLYNDEELTGNRVDPRWRDPITLKCTLTIVKQKPGVVETDPTFFETSTKLLPNGKSEFEIIGYTGSDKNVVIPGYINNKAVRRIGENAFRNKEITSIIFPESDSLHYISKNAFRGCTSLVKITLCKSIDTIDDYGFMGIAADTITLGANVKYLGEDAFGQTQLKRITVEALNAPVTKPIPDKDSPATATEGSIFAGSELIDTIFIPKGSQTSYENTFGWGRDDELLKEKIKEKVMP